MMIVCKCSAFGWVIHIFRVQPKYNCTPHFRHPDHDDDDNEYDNDNNFDDDYDFIVLDLRWLRSLIIFENNFDLSWWLSSYIVIYDILLSYMTIILNSAGSLWYYLKPRLTKLFCKTVCDEADDDDDLDDDVGDVDDDDDDALEIGGT